MNDTRGGGSSQTGGPKTGKSKVGGSKASDGIPGSLAEHATAHEFPRDDRPTALA